ncbi:MAG: class I SAM-dependent methyltransferase [Deltaproteobacteria bacterium]|nr:class I SAM-dependent methyltransferase [Deltaproteobacteria bacterium]
MPHPFIILWRTPPDPEISEIHFSFDFCRKISKRFCNRVSPDALWIDYRGFPNMGSLLSRAKGDILILVTDPGVILSPRAIEAFLNFARTGHDICGPVYNQTPYSAQAASLPATYFDMDSFLEVAAITSETQSRNSIETDTLDPACISFRLDFLKSMPSQRDAAALLKDPGRHGSPVFTVVPGALVHTGFIKTFASERDDLVRLVPENSVSNILDVGCAMGGFGKKLRRLYPDIFLTGVELNPLMARTANLVYDEIINLPIEEALFSTQFDLINCGDVLEHLTDPWQMLKRFHGLLRDNGNLVLSIPNVGHWSVAKALLKGTFQYIPLGLLCIGHLRWFTESSIRESLINAGFEIAVFEKQQVRPTPEGRAFIQHACDAGYGDEQSLKTHNFIIRAVKKNN